jgi:hypothetical protein
VEFKYTKHQTARGSRPDDESFDKVFLIKNVTELRATYQVRMLAYMATKKGKKLVIQLPKGAKLHGSLKELRKNVPNVIKVERV